MNLTHWQDKQMQGLLTAATEDELFDVLAAAAYDLGFEYCAYGLRMPLPVSNPKMYMKNNYSRHWQDRYARQNYLRIDPTVAHGMQSVLPLVWTDKVFGQCPEFWEDARGHGLRVGWAQSSYDARGVGGLLTLARSHDSLGETELREHSLKMSWLVQVAHEGMTRLVSIATPSHPPLTPREIEVLRWTADGKTSGEVGQIMHISERTVNFHVNNALEKLGAVNKTAGVIKAAMLRLL